MGHAFGMQGALKYGQICHSFGKLQKQLLLQRRVHATVLLRHVRYIFCRRQKFALPGAAFLPSKISDDNRNIILMKMSFSSNSSAVRTRLKVAFLRY